MSSRQNHELPLSRVASSLGLPPNAMSFETDSPSQQPTLSSAQASITSSLANMSLQADNLRQLLLFSDTPASLISSTTNTSSETENQDQQLPPTHAPASPSLASMSLEVNPPKEKPKTLTEFTIFPDLPAELRYLVWEFAEQPRVVDLEVFVQHESWETMMLSANRDNRWERIKRRQIRSRAQQPITLSICRESRLETLKRYKPYFNVPQGIYINPTIDCLDFARGLIGSHETLKWLVTPETAAEIQNMMLTCYDIDSSDLAVYYWKGLAQSLSIFHGLKTIWIRFASRNCGDDYDSITKTIIGKMEEIFKVEVEKGLVPGRSVPKVVLFDGRARNY